MFKLLAGKIGKYISQEQYVHTKGNYEINHFNVFSRCFFTLGR